MTTTKTATEAHAETYRCEPRTIRRWRSEGAPLNDAVKMREWLSSRKHLPEGTKLWLFQTGDVSAEASAPGTGADTTENEATGAGNALKRLEQAEADAYSVLRKALKAGDPFAVKAARESWLKIGDSLRRYDLMVDSARRANGELIQKEHVQDALKMFAMYFQASVSQLRSAMVPTFAGETSMPKLDSMLEDFANEGIISGLAGYLQWMEQHHPTKAKTLRWMVDSLNDGFGQKYNGWESSVEKRVEFWRFVAGKICESNGVTMATAGAGE